jgi:NADH:ubiquinone oxidoreductase subunit 5 (subunit L)/multisubunit Na+/H+ antiporter MnhA subunit
VELSLTEMIGGLTIAGPAALFALLGISGLLGRRLTERTTVALTHAAVLIGLAASIWILISMLTSGEQKVVVDLGDWFSIPQQHLHFHLKFLFDRLSVPFVMLTFILCGTVAVFSSRYMHREEGFARFFFLYAMFLLGMSVSSLAGTIETLFFGWELVGLSSALLVAFFQERRAPVQNGLRVWGIYRISDAAFLIAALLLHHLTGAGDFEALVGAGPWPEGAVPLSSTNAFVVGLLLLIAAAGKSALVPFSGWLPRAMEGPTPSSAIFYGALSVHLGAYLLLRCYPLLEQSLSLRCAIVILGLVSAGFGAMTARVQTDIKSSLAYASLTQVGLIVAEIGLGLHYLPLIHMIGHACMRTLQFVRAPSLLQDYDNLEGATGGHLVRRGARLGHLLPEKLADRFYPLALERGHLDNLLDTYIVDPFLAVFVRLDALEQRLTARWRNSAQTTAPATAPESASTAPSKGSAQ